MSTIKDIEYKLNNYLFNDFDKTKHLYANLYIQLFCSNCKNKYCWGMCCSQSTNVVIRPIKVFTKETLKEEIGYDFIEITDLCPLIFITLEKYLNNISKYDLEY